MIRRPLIVLILFIPLLGRAHLCREMFIDYPKWTRNLTQIYIYRNSQFPLHSNLIQAALAADIVVNRLSADSPLDFTAVARALNNLHQRYQVPIRIIVPGEKAPESMRTITIEDLTQVVAPMLQDNFVSLEAWGYIQHPLPPRALLFWKTIQDFFDSAEIAALAIQYKKEVSASQVSPKALYQIKDFYHKTVLDDFINYLEVHMRGLTVDERVFLSKSLIF